METRIRDRGGEGRFGAVWGGIASWIGRRIWANVRSREATGRGVSMFRGNENLIGALCSFG